MKSHGVLDFSFGDYLTEILVFLSLFLIASWWLQRKDKWTDAGYSFPPGPYRLPILGNLIGLKDGERYLASLAPLYGDLCTIFMGSLPVVVVNSAAAAKELMSDPNLFNERAPTPVLNNYFKGRGLAGAHCPDGFWKDQRKFVTKILRSLSGTGYHSFEAKLQDEIDYLRDIVKQRADGRPFDILKSLQLSCANFIWVLSIGQRFQHSDPFHQRVVALLYDTLRAMKYVTASLVFPLLLRIPGNGVSKMFNYLDQIYAMIAEKVTSYRQQRGNPNSEDFVGLFIQEMDKYSDDPTKAPAYLNEDNLRFVLQDLILAGVDTTSTTLYWLVLYLARNSAIQRKAFDDVSRVTGDRKRVTLDDYNNLPYINALIMETLRVTAMVPITARSNIRDFEYKGHRIPRGTWFLFNFYNMAQDESYWTNPTAFVPERFLDKNYRLVSHETFKPFGFGRRNCLGEVFAKKETFLLLANLVKDFEFLLEDEGNPSTVEPVTGLMRTPQPYKVRIRDRNTPPVSPKSETTPSIMKIQSTLPLDCGLWSNEVRLACKT